MTILTTGVTGLLGRQLIPRLQERDADIRALVLPKEDATWLEQRGIKIFRGDVRQPASLVEPFRGVDKALHLAGMMGVWLPLADYSAVNVAGTLNVARAAQAAGVERLVHVSSWTVYGIDLGKPADESMKLQPFSDPYPLSKTAGDRLIQRMIREDQLRAVIVRPGTFFGPGDNLHFNRMAARLASGRGVIIGSGQNALPFVYVSDVVQGLLLALEHPSAVGEAYNITNDAPLTQEEMLRAIASAIGAPPPRIHLPYRPMYSAAIVAERLAPALRLRQPPVTRLGAKLFGTDNRHSIAKARRELGFAPQVSLLEGVRLAAAAYLSVSRPDHTVRPVSSTSERGA
ncbi:MAG TPA: NAD-dependent epimerase/dehydratase family protein [Chloroflexota bacterium]|nr:NAD-dependent epimerase/dehydratase family protein [Chloroflexota bacterium]